jgi:hypothetical protein
VLAARGGNRFEERPLEIEVRVAPVAHREVRTNVFHPVVRQLTVEIVPELPHYFDAIHVEILAELSSVCTARGREELYIARKPAVPLPINTQMVLLEAVICPLK